MAVAKLSIDLDAVIANWRALDALSASSVETAAVVKANGYGLDSGRASGALAQAGAKTFFVATVEEAFRVYATIGHLNPKIYVFSGHMAGDSKAYYDMPFCPMLNSPEQVARHQKSTPKRPYGLQLDTGMNRLGLEASDFTSLQAVAENAALIISHLACADEPDHPQNAAQLSEFKRITAGLDVPKSLAATGGTLLGNAYHFDMCRPGVGLYGGFPYENAHAVVNVSIPTIQTRDIEIGESVGYAAGWVATRPSKVATLSAGYADGLIRAMGTGGLSVWAGDVACPIIGRVSMDLLTVDVTDLGEVPDAFEILNAKQTVDMVADAAGTIGYEILTSLGGRYERVYKGG